jgi:hypothetical protein
VAGALVFENATHRLSVPGCLPGCVSGCGPGKVGVVGDGSTLWLPEMWFVLPVFHRVNCQILASCFICHDVARFLELVARRDVSGKPHLRMLRTVRPPTTNHLSLLVSPRLRVLPRLPGARAAPRLHTPQGDSTPRPRCRPAVAPPSPRCRPNMPNKILLHSLTLGSTVLEEPRTSSYSAVPQQHQVHPAIPARHGSYGRR